MRRCPACGELGIFEYSVLLNLEAVAKAREPDGSFPPVYSRCAQCASVFRRGGPDAFVPETADDLLPERQVVWTLPPWASKSDEASFRMSWDVTEAFFERQAAELAWVAPLYDLMRELRAEGFDALLRGGPVSQLAWAEPRAGARPSPIPESPVSLAPARRSDRGLRIDLGSEAPFRARCGRIRRRASLRRRRVEPDRGRLTCKNDILTALATRTACPNRTQ